jgi:flagellar secretion chaperone FliS
MYRNVANTYQQANVLTANPLKLVLMCYEGAIGSLKLARDSYLAKEYEIKGRSLQKAMDIIDELNATIDMEKGGEIAANLRSLYTFMTGTLIEADLKRDLKVFDEVIHMLEELESAWKQIAAPAEPAGDVRPQPPTGVIPSSRSAGPVALARAWSA